MDGRKLDEELAPIGAMALTMAMDVRTLMGIAERYKALGEDLDASLFSEVGELAAQAADRLACPERYDREYAEELERRRGETEYTIEE